MGQISFCQKFGNLSKNDNFRAFLFLYVQSSGCNARGCALNRLVNVDRRNVRRFGRTSKLEDVVYYNALTREEQQYVVSRGLEQITHVVRSVWQVISETQ